MAVRRADGSSGLVEQVTVEQRAEEMYNLTVADAHTFFVGEEGWLVHNACKALLNGKSITPSELGEQLARLADDIFEDLPRATKGSATIAVTKVDGNIVVALNSGINPRAAQHVIDQGWQPLYDPSFGHAVDGHAERMLYREYGDALDVIGISHVTGPCKGWSGCRSFFKTTQIELVWTGVFKR